MDHVKRVGIWDFETLFLEVLPHFLPARWGREYEVGTGADENRERLMRLSLGLSPEVRKHLGKNAPDFEARTWITAGLDASGGEARDFVACAVGSIHFGPSVAAFQWYADDQDISRAVGNAVLEWLCGSLAMRAFCTLQVRRGTSPRMVGQVETMPEYLPMCDAYVTGLYGDTRQGSLQVAFHGGRVIDPDQARSLEAGSEGRDFSAFDLRAERVTETERTRSNFLRRQDERRNGYAEKRGRSVTE